MPIDFVSGNVYEFTYRDGSSERLRFEGDLSFDRKGHPIGSLWREIVYGSAAWPGAYVLVRHIPMDRR